MSSYPNTSYLYLNIKFNTSQAFPLSVPLSSNIREVKREIARKAGLEDGAYTNIEVIFAGKVLTNDTSLKDLSLGSQSILHVFQESRTLPPIDVNCVSGESSPAQVRTSDKSQAQYQYFVYCKECDSLQPGKLRVSCCKCNEGGVVLQREPENWEDVLQNQRIQGDCRTCQAKQPVKFYFKCAGHEGSDSERAVPLRHIRPNRKLIECITCVTVSTPVLVFPCAAKHVMCLECFKRYCIVRLNDRMFIQDPIQGYTLPCPAGCENSLIQENHHFCLIGKEQYERYKNFGAEEYLLNSGGVLCPHPGCGEGMIPDEDRRKITCSNCRYEFCRRCHLDYHDGDCSQRKILAPPTESIPVDSDREQRSRWEVQSLETIEKTTKSCPKCHTRTERAGGCMHMKCTQCKLDWCWMCEKSWNRDCQGDHWFG